MADDSHQRPSKLDDLRKIDSISDKFEAAIRTQQKPSISLYLKEAPSQIEAALFVELLSLELSYRRGAGLPIDRQDYLTRFEQHREAVQRALPAEPITHVQQPDDTLVADTQPLLAPSVSGKRIGDYQIQEEIARGGMGVVYKAKQIRLNRTIALKMILKGQFASKLEVTRFYTEAKAIAALEHPGIISIYDVDCLDDNHFYTMNFVNGQSLAKHFNNRASQEQEAIRIVRDIANAMSHAHSKGVIHRDLKLENVLIDTQDDIHIIDFGLCKSDHAGTGDTVTGQLLGTPIYMSPEQARGSRRDVGVATDIYAMGMILYRLGTARFPFESQYIYELLQQIESKDPPSPKLFNSSLSSEFERICLCCLQKKAADRYPTAEALAQDLAQSLIQYPNSPPQQPWSRPPVTQQNATVLRRPLRTLLVLGLLALITGLGASVAAVAWKAWAGTSKTANQQIQTDEQLGLFHEPLQNGLDTSLNVEVDQENQFTDIIVGNKHPTVIEIELTLECSQFNFYMPPGSPPAPSIETIASDPNVVTRRQLQENIRAHFEYKVSLQISDQSGKSLATIESDIKWNSADNDYQQVDLWNEESRSVTTRFRRRLTVINPPEGNSKTINATIHVEGDTLFDSKILSCKLELEPSSGGE